MPGPLASPGRGAWTPLWRDTILEWWLRKNGAVRRPARDARLNNEYIMSMTQLWIEQAKLVVEVKPNQKNLYQWDLDENDFILFATHAHRRDACIPIPPPLSTLPSLQEGTARVVADDQV